MTTPRLHHDAVGLTLPTTEMVDQLDAEALVDLVTQLGALTERARARLAVSAARPADATQGDTLLTPDAAAAKIATTTDWLYRHAAKLPFTVRLSEQQLRFSAKGIDRWIALRQRAARDR